MSDNYGALHRDHAHYDEDLEDYIFDTKYNFPVIKKKIIHHFKDGGLSHPAVLAGICEVSRATMMRWRDRNSVYFKPELDSLIKEYKAQAASVTDKWHRESARGDRKDANAHTLNRRAEKLFDMGETKKIIQEQKITLRTIEEIDEEMERIEGECEGEKI